MSALMANVRSMKETLTTRDALARAAGALGAVDHAERRSLAHAERLALVDVACRLSRQAEALRDVLISEADRADSSVVERGTPLTSWLSLSGQLTSKEAAGMVFAGRDLAGEPQVADAALSGEVTVRQARAITKTLGELPATLTPVQRERAGELLLERASRTHADALSKLAQVVLAEVCPEQAESAEDEQHRLEARRLRAWARRSLTFLPDGDGSVLVRGSLPDLEAAAFIKLVAAHVESDRRTARERRDPDAAIRTPDQRRADGLIALVAAHGADRRAPSVAGDRPRIVVTLRERELRERAEQAGILESGQAITAGELRRLCCDAELVPVVLGVGSEVLDMGTAQRLVTPAIRRALSVRDAGCIFPGCDAPDWSCDAHHVQPWWAGGKTALGNLVLLCPHHHRLVEPDRFGTRPGSKRWEVQMDDRGMPTVVPPP